MVIRGAVQGVGFRPFIYRLATELRLLGWVNNSSHGVFIEVEGPRLALDEFLLRVPREKPAIAFVQSMESSFADPVGYTCFDIRESTSGEKTALVMPDVATCPDCLREIRDPKNRRYRYPFTNCTNCGPRFTIIEELPYDRPRTTMKGFTMCPECAREYKDPADRRFHAQPNACPLCGPHLELLTTDGRMLAAYDEALNKAADAIACGQIVAVKGLGGFHLMVDARNNAAVQLLRTRKHREEKPFALMMPSLDAVRVECEVSPLEEQILTSTESPIVLLRRLKRTALSGLVAPGNPYLGVMLPYTPLHHLLLEQLGFPVVATSGNASDEPICITNEEAKERLCAMADLLLVHDRPILRHADDSIVRVIAGRQLIMRRARGFAPLPVTVKEEMSPTLGVGAHQKNTVALAVGKQVFVSQHIGDLETEQAFGAFRGVIGSLEKLYESQPQTIACDMHPNYLSSEFAHARVEHPVEVQHHYAHVLACMAENEIEAPALGVAWDGSGYGPDGTVWGGEFLKITAEGYERIAHLRTFPLIGSEKAVREPRRCALGILHEMFGEKLRERGELHPMRGVNAQDLNVLLTMLARGLNAPRTSSAGRLFDAVASLVGHRHVARYEGQAALELEFEASRNCSKSVYPFAFEQGALDWAPMVLDILDDIANGFEVAHISRKFHNTLAEMIAEVAVASGETKIALSGGCFQNRLLTETTIEKLQARGLRPYWHQRVPPNDGCIALGQIVAASRELRSKEV
jgi:hydrogenase maturation protein HypF